MAAGKAQIVEDIAGAVEGLTKRQAAEAFEAVVASVRKHLHSDGTVKVTGLGSFSLALTSVPPATDPTVATMLWALPIGVACALLGWLIRWIGLSLRPLVHLNRVLVTAALGLVIGLIAMAYQLISGRSFKDVLFSGQNAMPDLIGHAAEYSVGLLILIIVCKALAYALSLSAFRGGPVFPSIFIGAAIGIAMSALPGASLAAAIASGIGAMCAAMLRLPLTATLLAVLLLGPDAATVTPQAVVAVATAFIIINLLPDPGPKTPESQPAAHAQPPAIA